MGTGVALERKLGPQMARLHWLSWTLLVVFGLWIAGLRGLAAHIIPLAAVSFTEQLLLTGFFVVHALGYYSAGEVAFFAITNALVSNLFENLSIRYGFPFGYYYHTVGPKLFQVPYLVTLIYLGLGYISWMVAQVLLRRMHYKSWKRMVFVAPLIAAFVFTCWDLCIDPVYGTVYRAFIYRNPGVWFGTPGGNYFGWLFTTYVFYLPFSLYLRRRADVAETRRTSPGVSYWLQPVLMYLAVAVGILLANRVGRSVNVTLLNGKVWNSGDIYGASTLVTIFTMIFIGMLALTILCQERDSQRA